MTVGSRRTPRVLILGAGTGPAENLARSLRAGDPSLRLFGAHSDRFPLRKSAAERLYLIPRPDDRHFLGSLCRVVQQERITVVVPTSDGEVQRLARARRRLSGRVLLPRSAVVELCQDKYALTAWLRARGVPVPTTFRVTRLESLPALFRRLGRPAAAWCRLRRGTASAGATRVRTPAQARSWILYWEQMRGVRPGSFTLSEYLPGRDFGAQSLWQDGRLVLLKTFERVSYFVQGGTPSGVSSAAALAKTVVEPRVAEVCAAAIRAIDPRATGVFSLDLKEDARGVPRVTEINAGRFLAGTPLLDLTGKHNMALTYVRIATGEAPEVAAAYDSVEGHYMVRDLDTLPGVFPAEVFFDGVHDMRRRPRSPETRGASERRPRHARQHPDPVAPGAREAEDRPGALRPHLQGGAREVPRDSLGVHPEVPRAHPAGEAQGQAEEAKAQEEVARGRPRGPGGRAVTTEHVGIARSLDPSAAEALRLEIRRLARRSRIRLGAVRIEALSGGSRR
jgi:carbamoyl-phosphate synthase large subunit